MLQYRVCKYTLQNQTKFSRLIKSLQNRPPTQNACGVRHFVKRSGGGLWANKGHQRADTLYIYIMLCSYMHALVYKFCHICGGSGWFKGFGNGGRSVITGSMG